MKNIHRLLITACLLSILVACNLPSTPRPTAENAGLPTIPAKETPASQLATPEAPAVPSETSLPGSPVVISQIHMLDENNGWGGVSKPDGTFQLLRTINGGQSWVNATPQDKSINLYGGSFLDGQTAWVPYFDPTSNAGSLLHTTDGGKTWISLPTIESAENASYEFTNLKDGVAQTAGVGAGNLYLNLYQTADGGQSWVPILVTAPKSEEGLPAGTVHLCNICGDGLHYDSSRIVITYGDLANDPAGAVRLAVSSDLGQNWKDLTLPLPDQKYAQGMTAPQSPTFFGTEGVLPVNLIKYNQDNSLAYSVLAIYNTQDGGQSWSLAPGLLENPVSQYQPVLIISPKDFFERCGRNLCSSKDGAQTWQTLPDTLNFDSAAGGADYVSQFSFVDATTGWAISGEGEATSLWKTTDGGKNWTKLTPELLP